MEKEYYSYLNVLRDSGVTNMFCASPYLEEEFGLSRRESKTVLLSWMNSFSAEPSKTEGGQ
jgi:hypothetical protein